MLHNNKLYNLSLVLLIVISASSLLYWILLMTTLGSTESGTTPYLIFAAVYGLVTLVGAINGLIYAKQWGGFKSVFGKVLLFLSTALLLTEFGQLVFSFYNIVAKVELPYPSIADIGFFGAIPMYVLGSFYILRVLNIKSLFKQLSIKTYVVLVIPLLMSVVTYFINFRGYSFADSSVLKVFLDFADPFGHALYVSFALIALTRSDGLYGGLLRKGLVVILCAFLLQYLADLNFLYQENHESWVNGGYGDVLYLFAYTVMSYGILQVGRVRSALIATPESQNG
jgi:hypothetical protein